MAVTAMALFVAFILLVAGLRGWIQWRRTGDIGDRRQIARRVPLQRWIDALATIGALSLGVLSPVASLAGLDLLLREPTAQVVGLALVVLGTAAVFVSQSALGESWRVGVDPDERTALVTSGVYSLVRNPILTAVIVTCTGLALMVPTVLAVVGLVAVVVANELLVRLVEEPHLRRMHGEEYLRYAASVGRFLPGIGRWR